MKREKHRGTCHLCGKIGKLTFEHIPPEATFNNQRAKVYSAASILDAKDDRMPWETQGLRYKQLQKGKGRYTLCESCNNITGSWYGQHYADFIHLVSQVIHSNRQAIMDSKYTGIKLDIKKVNLLAVFKQVVSMFCSINDNNINGYVEQLTNSFSKSILFDSQTFSNIDKELKEFVLSKNSNDFDTNKYTVTAYISRGTMERFYPFFVVGGLDTQQFGFNKMKIVAEIATYPVGFLFYLNVPKEYRQEYNGTDITNFSRLPYAECDLKISLPIYDCYSYIPDDHRSKEELIQIKNKFDARQIP